MNTSKILPLAVLGLLACSSGLQAQGSNSNNLLPVVIVIRHGEDRDPFIDAKDKNNAALNNWKTSWAPNWPNYTLPNSTNVQVHQHGLSDFGEKQAAFLVTSLPELLKSENFMPIARVVTKDPWTDNESGGWPTPNPFDTAWPLIKTLGIQDVMLIKDKKGTNPYGPRAGKKNETVDKDLLAMLPCYHGEPDKPADSILPTDSEGKVTGSTLIVWDGQGMWGPHPKDGWYWADDFDKPEDFAGKFSKTGANVLRLLGGLRIPNILRERSPQGGGGLPGKARRLYLFYPRYGTGPLYSQIAPQIIKASEEFHGTNNYGTNTIITPKYDLMVWDLLSPENKPTGWTNIATFQVSEATKVETILRNQTR
ncbi:MAG: hypothetical protein FGM15_09490 [Chthoniobacterales bacterium]|nr:hypothetical protein [Chthoniobacterales bacterium]